MVAPARWFVLDDGERTGPLGIDAVRDRVVAGTVTATTWVWADGMPGWRRAGRVPALVPPSPLGVPGWPVVADEGDAPGPAGDAVER